MSDEVKDIAGVPIEVGDTVVYGVKSEYSTLQMGKVIKLIPYSSKRNVDNPNYNPSLPSPYNRVTRTYDNPRMISEPCIDYKIRMEITRSYWDSKSQQYEEEKSTKTLDKPSRFAVIKKYDPQRS